VFEWVLDCGLFHAFDSDERRHYVASLAAVTGRGGTYACSVIATSDLIPVARIRSLRKS
jgi:hypothetical protein